MSSKYLVENSTDIVCDGRDVDPWETPADWVDRITALTHREEDPPAGGLRNDLCDRGACLRKIVAGAWVDRDAADLLADRIVAADAERVAVGGDRLQYLGMDWQSSELP